MIEVITFGTATKRIGAYMSEMQENVFAHYHVDDHIEKCSSHREYEETASKTNIKLTNNEKLFIVNPASDVSGALLVYLEKAASKPITLVCLLSDFDFLSKKQVEQSKFVAGVLQEMARSGLIAELVFINQKFIEKKVENLSIKDYYKQVDEYISKTVSMWLWSREVDCVIDNSIESIPIARISTLGTYDLEENKIHMFFDLTFSEKDAIFPLEIDFYFMLKSESLDETELFSNIKESIKHKKNSEFQGANIGFKILEGSSQFTLVHIRTSKIQNI
jgi:hypothetical protein